MTRSIARLIERRAGLLARAFRLDDAGHAARADRVWCSVARIDRALLRRRNDATAKESEAGA